MNKVKPFIWAEIVVSEKSADISKIKDKQNFFCLLPNSNQILGKVIKRQVNTISLSKVMTFFI